MAEKKWADHAMVSLEWAGDALFIREFIPMVPFLDKNFGSPLDAMYVLKRKGEGTTGRDPGTLRDQELGYVKECVEAFEKYLLENIKRLIAQNPGDESLKFRNVSNIFFRLEYTCERFHPIVNNKVKSVRDVFAPLNLESLESLSVREIIK